MRKADERNRLGGRRGREMTHSHATASSFFFDYPEETAGNRGRKTQKNRYRDEERQSENNRGAEREREKDREAERERAKDRVR